MDLPHRLRGLLFLVFGLVAWASIGCSKGNPVAPTGPDGAMAAFGDLHIRYERPEDVHQNMVLRPPGVGCVAESPVRVFSAAGQWPNGFEIRDPNDPNPRRNGLDLVRAGERVFEAVVKNAPAGTGLPIQVFEPCRTDHFETGTGIWVNGVKLKDETYWARFDHKPGLNPSVVPR